MALRTLTISATVPMVTQSASIRPECRIYGGRIEELSRARNPRDQPFAMDPLGQARDSVHARSIAGVLPASLSGSMRG